MAPVLLIRSGVLASSVLNVPHLTVELQVATGLVLFGTINGVQMGALAGLRPEGSAAFEPRGACHGRRPGQDGGRDRETADDANLYAVCSANALINVATYDWSRICDRCDELYRAAS